ncbi:hypothetical protein Vadar_003694 [Vaccinium darrowii]|uniref:Uncharacterized protein n=1 Tax=Vaccinium darrowii TaxID=229202 RepID=A0ACB7XFP7_9ERIC|nr:hypothetical protein Vadar_003694 [Vaccinium darrowii]
MKLLKHTPPALLLRFQTEGETKTTKEPSQPPSTYVLHHRRPAKTPYRLPPLAATKACSNPTEPRRDPNAIATTKVTDAPEIHSNGFHVKLDITEWQIGFVLPTVLPSCDINLFQRLACCHSESNSDTYCWNPYIVLPFRTNVSEGSPINSFKPYVFSSSSIFIAFSSPPSL